MEKQFVSYELALQLRSLGFDEYCFAFYWTDTTQLVCDNDFTGKHSGVHLQAPLWQQALDWFRDNHGLDSNIISWKKGDKIFYQFSVKKLGEAGKYRSIECEVEDRYIAQIKCLEKLIEKISNGKK